MAEELTVIIGAGPAGLAAGAALRMRAVNAIVMDRAAAVGDSWRHHYDRLHLHTARSLSGLPGLAIPAEYGRYVARANVVRYLEQYAEHHRLTLRLGTKVRALRRTDGGWSVDTSHGELAARHVIIATGYNHTPFLPEWPGREAFQGELLHASAYRRPAPFEGRSVLVVGTGNTGAEIAVDLVEGGAREVWLSARTPPNIMRRELFGVPTQAVAVAIRHLPTPVMDPIIRGIQRLTVGDLRPYGVERSPRGVLEQVRRDGQIPILDVGLIDALRAKRLRVVGAVRGFDGRDVLLEGEERLQPEVVIAATGYRCGLESLVGPLGILDDRGHPTVHGARTSEAAPGLHFIGYSNPISGNLREIALDARRIARAIAAARA